MAHPFIQLMTEQAEAILNPQPPQTDESPQTEQSPEVPTVEENVSTSK